MRYGQEEHRRPRRRAGRSEVLSWQPFFKVRYPRSQQEEKMGFLKDVDNTIRFMDTLYDTDFHTWVKKEANMDYIIIRLQGILKDYSLEQISRGLLWIISDWDEERSDLFIYKLIQGWNEKQRYDMWRLLRKNRSYPLKWKTSHISIYNSWALKDKQISSSCSSPSSKIVAQSTITDTSVKELLKSIESMNNEMNNTTSNSLIACSQESFIVYTDPLVDTGNLVHFVAFLNENPPLSVHITSDECIYQNTPSINHRMTMLSRRS